jgi:hypothetical protein
MPPQPPFAFKALSSGIGAAQAAKRRQSSGPAPLSKNEAQNISSGKEGVAERQGLSTGEKKSGARKESRSLWVLWFHLAHQWLLWSDHRRIQTLVHRTRIIMIDMLVVSLFMIGTIISASVVVRALLQDEPILVAIRGIPVFFKDLSIGPLFLPIFIVVLVGYTFILRWTAGATLGQWLSPIPPQLHGVNHRKAS